MLLRAEHNFFRKQVELMARVGTVQNPWPGIAYEGPALLHVTHSVRDNHGKPNGCIEKENLEFYE